MISSSAMHAEGVGVDTLVGSSGRLVFVGVGVLVGVAVGVSVCLRLPERFRLFPGKPDAPSLPPLVVFVPILAKFTGQILRLLSVLMLDGLAVHPFPTTGKAVDRPVSILKKRFLSSMRATFLSKEDMRQHSQ